MDDSFVDFVNSLDCRLYAGSFFGLLSMTITNHFLHFYFFTERFSTKFCLEKLPLQIAANPLSLRA